MSKKKPISKAKPSPKVTKQSQSKSVKAQPQRKAPVAKAPAKRQPAPAPKKKVTAPVKQQPKAKKVVKKVQPSRPAPPTSKNKQKKPQPKPTKQVPQKGKKVISKPQSKKPTPKGKKSAPQKKHKRKNRGSTEYQKIKKYILDRYKRRTNVVTDEDARDTAHAIYEWLKINGKLKDKKAVTHKLLKEALANLFPQEQKMFGRKRVPEIPDRYQVPNEFYNIDEVIQDHRKGIFRRIWIYSPLILGKRNNGYVFLDPSKTYTYEETFQAWVDYINDLINGGTFSAGSPPEVWYKFNNVFWNSRRKRWEVSIIPCDSDGNIFNTGFVIGEDVDTDNTEENYGIDPDEFNRGKEEAEQLKEEINNLPPVEEKPAAPSAPAQEAREVTDAKLKTELEKQKAYKIQALMQAKQSIMEDIRFNKEIGEPIDDLMIKLKAIRDQVDKLI